MFPFQKLYLGVWQPPYSNTKINNKNKNSARAAKTANHEKTGFGQNKN